VQAEADGPLVGEFFQRGGFGQGDGDARVEFFPDARHGEEHGRLDLAHVLRNGLRVFDKIQPGAGVQREIGARHALGYVAQGQEAHVLVFLALRDDEVEAAHGMQHVVVRKHRPLGPAGGAGGVDEDGQVFRLAAVDARLPFAFGFGAEARDALAADFAQAPEADHLRVVEVAQAFGLPDDDFSQERQVVARFQYLVELLLVLDEQIDRTGIQRQVLNLGGSVGWIDAGADAAGAQRTEIAEQPFLAGVAEDRDRLAGFEAQLDQAHADVAHDVAELAPGQRLPESVGFLAENDLVAAPLDGIPEHARDRVARHNDLAACPGLRIVRIPPHSCIRINASSSSSSSGACRARRFP